MTVVEVLGRVDELADGTGGTAEAVRGDGNRSISEIPVYLIDLYFGDAC